MFVLRARKKRKVFRGLKIITMVPRIYSKGF